MDPVESNREQRIRELMELKAEYLKIMQQNNGFDTDNNAQQNQNTNTKKSNTRGHSKTLSTEVGRRMTDRENGFSSALFIGVISLLFEIAFLIMAIVLFK